MNRYVIVDGLPYLLANGKTYTVRWDEMGYTVGAEVKLASVPARTYSELSVLAKCADHLDSISAPEATQEAVDFDSMTLKELKAYAETHGIDLTGITKKTDILKAVKAE